MTITVEQPDIDAAVREWAYGRKPQTPLHVAAARLGIVDLALMGFVAGGTMGPPDWWVGINESDSPIPRESAAWLERWQKDDPTAYYRLPADAQEWMERWQHHQDVGPIEIELAAPLPEPRPPVSPKKPVGQMALLDVGQDEVDILCGRPSWPTP